jgi:hypothetical protein
MLNDPERKVPMDLYIVKIDETKWWDDEVFQRHPSIKRIFGVYMTDVNTYIYCAELTPSYYLEFLEYQWDGDEVDDDERERIDDLFLKNVNSNDNHYRYTSEIDNADVFSGFFPEGVIGKTHWHTYSVESIKIGFSDDEKEVFDHAIEDFRGNPI